MTLAELLALAHWSDGLATLSVDVPLFGRPVKFTVAAAREGALSERTAETVRQVRALGASDLARIHQVVWDNYLLNMEVVGYGVDVREGQTETEANIESFGVRDAAAAYAGTTLRYCWIDEENQASYAANYATLQMDNEWESHGVNVVIRDGRVAGGGEDGIWVGQFEPDDVKR